MLAAWTGGSGRTWTAGEFGEEPSQPPHHGAAFRRAAGDGALTLAGAAVGRCGRGWPRRCTGVVALSKTGERVHAYLGNEADHFFVAAALLLGMLTVLAAVSAVAVWQWRAHRGPVMVAALTIGSALGGWPPAGSGRPWPIDATASTSPRTGDPGQPVPLLHRGAVGFFGHSPVQMATGLPVPAAGRRRGVYVAGRCATHDDLGGSAATWNWRSGHRADAHSPRGRSHRGGVPPAGR